MEFKSRERRRRRERRAKQKTKACSAFASLLLFPVLLLAAQSSRQQTAQSSRQQQNDNFPCFLSSQVIYFALQNMALPVTNGKIRSLLSTAWGIVSWGFFFVIVGASLPLSFSLVPLARGKRCELVCLQRATKKNDSDKKKRNFDGGGRSSSSETRGDTGGGGVLISQPPCVRTSLALP